MVVGERDARAADVADCRDGVKTARAVVAPVELAALGHGRFAVAAGADECGVVHGSVPPNSKVEAPGHGASELLYGYSIYSELV